MTDTRSAKLQTLNEFRRKLPYAIASALSVVLKEACNNGIPALRSRHHMAEATGSAVNACTPHGELLIELEFVPCPPATSPIVVPVVSLTEYHAPAPIVVTLIVVRLPSMALGAPKPCPIEPYMAADSMTMAAQGGGERGRRPTGLLADGGCTRRLSPRTF